MPATHDEIVACYRILLGREPDEDGFNQHAGAGLPLELLVRGFLNSDEFRQRSTAMRIQPVHGLDFAVPAADPMYHADYEPHVFHPMLERICQGTGFLDVGANIGVFAIHAAKRGATVIAVEALASNARLLLDNAARNGVGIELHPLAASDRHGHAMLDLGESLNAMISPQGNSLQRNSLQRKGLVVATAPLDALIGDRRIDVLKIDVEGHEYRAMLGALQLLKRCRPVVFTEYSPALQRATSGVEGMDYLSVFLELGYRMYLLGEQGPEPVEPESVDAIWRSRNTTHIDLMLALKRITA